MSGTWPWDAGMSRAGSGLEGETVKCRLQTVKSGSPLTAQLWKARNTALAATMAMQGRPARGGPGGEGGAPGNHWAQVLWPQEVSTHHVTLV